VILGGSASGGGGRVWNAIVFLTSQAGIVIAKPGSRASKPGSKGAYDTSGARAASEVNSVIPVVLVPRALPVPDGPNVSDISLPKLKLVILEEERKRFVPTESLSIAGSE